jgi:hypothetical protein
MKSIKSVFIKATCMLAFVLITNSFSRTQAQQVQLNYVADANSSGDIRFVSVEGDMLVFELNLKSLPAKGSMLKIVDQAGNLLFQESIRTETFNVRYKIERNNISKIIFEVSNKKFLLNRSFSINTRIEERVEVAKI